MSRIKNDGTRAKETVADCGARKSGSLETGFQMRVLEFFLSVFRSFSISDNQKQNHPEISSFPSPADLNLQFCTDASSCSFLLTDAHDHFSKKSRLNPISGIGVPRELISRNNKLNQKKFGSEH